MSRSGVDTLTPFGAYHYDFDARGLFVLVSIVILFLKIRGDMLPGQLQVMPRAWRAGGLGRGGAETYPGACRKHHHASTAVGIGDKRTANNVKDGIARGRQSGVVREKRGSDPHYQGSSSDAIVCAGPQHPSPATERTPWPRELMPQSKVSFDAVSTDAR
jgi:hypothetical protein